jgi:phosphoribosylformylglycinamidine synthase
MAASIGCEVDLTRVHLKYPGLAPWEIWLSEAQERMVLAVPPQNIPTLQELCNTFDTELTDIGKFTGNGRLIVRYRETNVVNICTDFLHKGIPQKQLRAIIQTPDDEAYASEDINLNIKETLLGLLASPNIASKASVIRLYDHEVQGGSVVKPLTGIEGDAPSDGAVIKPIGTKGMKGVVLSNGINPEYGKHNAYKMAWSVMDEAIRNAVVVGADPERIAVLDNFCWGDPLQPETMGSLVEACRGCHDAALFFSTPFISGKDSLNNEYFGSDGLRHAIPPTLLISAIGFIEDVNCAITMDLKAAGNLIYLVGEFSPMPKSIPEVPASTRLVYRALHQAITNGLVKSAHDLSEGGLAVAAAEMCIGGRLGLNVNVEPSGLFTEVNGCLLIEVSPKDATAFEKKFIDLPFIKIARVLAEPILKFSAVEISVEELVQAFNYPVNR